MLPQRIFRVAAALGVLSVALGAFGAHGLKSLASAAELSTFETAVRYQFYHVFALALTGVLAHLFPQQTNSWRRAAWAFGWGIIIFSGSLYALTAAKINGLEMGWLGAITPLGGLGFIIGWILLFFALPRK
ncbi:MAG: DUF423 domain-containing protein [Bacteroidota bacterium]